MLYMSWGPWGGKLRHIGGYFFIISISKSAGIRKRENHKQKLSSLCFLRFLIFEFLFIEMIKRVSNVLLLATLWFFKTFFKDASLPNILCFIFIENTIAST